MKNYIIEKEAINRKQKLGKTRTIGIIATHLTQKEKGLKTSHKQQESEETKRIGHSYHSVMKTKKSS